MIAIVVLLSVLAVAGIAIAVAPPRPVTAPIRSPLRSRRAGSRLAGSIVLALVVFVVSGWVLPAVVAGVGTYWASSGWQQRRSTAEAEIVKLDALASWIENVRDVLTAGEQTIGAIQSTVGAASPVIRPAVRRLAAGLGRQDPDLVFRRFADDLDDPLGDLVAAGLSIAVRRGARTVPVLSALAEQARDQVDRRRLIDAERAPTRREVQALTLIMGLLVLGLLLLGRSEYLDAYDSTGGQIFLSVSLAGYAALIIRVQQLAAFPRPSRFLTSASTGMAGAR